ncbi:MAG: 3'(2'),5'-bisphosphate nucleotidase CysQ, partial [Rhodospirillaceae bacterium]|nr:3'(2'),5'-bisphosphate nucleotidase CysQ [Rhodospirillaceae bacterium]
MEPSTTELLDAITDIARKAGDIIMEIYGGEIEVMTKADSSPVTLADQAAEDYIIPALVDLTPDIPIVAEEAASAGQIPDISGSRFWLVDPLDGTKEFISRNGEFTVNIALVEDGR